MDEATLKILVELILMDRKFSKFFGKKFPKGKPKSAKFRSF